jgi:hypothetical protein
MTDHDPLAELRPYLRHEPGCPRNDARLRKMRGYDYECTCGLEAIEQGYEVRPKLTAERLEATMRATMHLPSDDGHDLDGHWDEWTVAILAALEGEPHA